MKSQNTLQNQTRHIRWNWEQSPDNVDVRDADLVRYHFIIVDDKNREGKLNKILASLSRYGELIPIRQVEGKVRGTDFRYLFASYDTPVRPDMLDFRGSERVVRRDSELRERKRGTIEDYVARLYEG